MFETAEAARAFLHDEIAAAKGQAPHWADMLSEDFFDAHTPPVLWIDAGGGVEVVDGMHRLAGLAATRRAGSVEAVLAVPPGADPGGAFGGDVSVLRRMPADEIPQP